uniref:CARDB domain-containing protein n=1 Tax=Spirulina sp. CCY15215 TaxID=2767591 RepID=UPI00194F2DCD
MDASFLDETSVLGAISPSQLGLEPPNTMIPAVAQDRRILNMALHNVQDRLQQFASSTHGFEQLDFIYDISDRAAVQSRLEAWSAGNFTDMPDMLVVDDAGMKGAMGAYSSERNEIYLGQSLLRSDALTGVLIEEYGHALDKEFNPGGDTVGDEGELLSVFLQSGGNIAEEELTRLRTESDRGEILFNGEIIAVEQATIIGNSGNNSLYGTNSSDSIFGYDGDDSLYGNGGNDTLDGGYGFDYIDGGTGTDTVTYSFYDGGINLDLRSISNNVSFPGNSTRKETVRNVENVIGSSGNDLLIGNSQNNTILGGNGSDDIYGDRGNDNLIGGAGNDTLDGYGFQSYEKDTLSGGSGGDKFILGTANQTYYTKNGHSDYATILDFNPYEGDTISLQKLSYDTSNSSNAYGYRLWQIGANTEIRVSKTNDLVATLQGITGVSLFNGFRFEGTPAYTDLIVQNQSTPSLAKAGDTIKLTSYVKNIGNATAGSSYLKYYLSDDAILDSGDKYLGLNYVGGLASGSASYEDFTVQLDKGLSGTKYLFFQADAYNWVSESNEFNNVAYKEIKITNPQPDLIVQNQSTPSLAKAGDTIKLTSYVKNIGDATAGYSYLKYYLSDDTNLDSGDKFLGNDYVGSLA